MENIELNYEFFNNCTSLSDAARKIFGRDNYRDCEKIKEIASNYGFDWKMWNERRKQKRKYTNCLNCGKKLTNSDYRTKFCSKSCAASYNNKQRGNVQTIGHTNCEYCGKDLYNKPIGTKFCSNECQKKKEQEEYIERWKNGEEKGLRGRYCISERIRKYLFEKYECKCQQCGWGEENPVTHKIPLQVHHIDGNCLNNEENNLQLLCPNCHSLTETFGNLNKESKRIFRKQKENL